MIVARHDRVVIKPNKAKDVSDGGILIPDKALAVKGEGEVLGIGPDVKSLEVGSTVLYSVYAGQEVEDDGGTVIVVPDNQIYGVRSSKTQTA